MFNGTVLFYKSFHGYRVASALPDSMIYTAVEDVYKFLQCVNIHGSFNFKPVRGQFCRKPHKLINWSK